MKDLESLALRVRSGRLAVLDQTRLPHAEVWLPADDPREMVGHIQRLAVRGAPLIGVCPQDQLPAIQEVIMRVQTEWTEKD